ncbi:MAG: HoxN/HupN/NixA family nickel/cobalt transporter [Rhodomicrobium sp.]
MNIFSDDPGTVKSRILGISAVLAVATLIAWVWALIAFRDYPVQLGTAFLAFAFGLRHAVDADHIAAIDNVTRKLMQEGKQPVAAGFFFSLGHSTVVWAGSAAIAIAAASFKDRIESFNAIGGIAGTLVSAFFLLAIAIVNVFILAATIKTFRRLRSGHRLESLNVLLASGFLARIFRPLFRIVTRSWHMYPLGVLFALGFDTATEIGVLGISATSASRGLSFWSILVFPALFTAGMSLADTADNILMLKAYGWAFAEPMRKLYYNMTMTFVSILIALVIGGLETLNLAGDKLQLKGEFWTVIGAINSNFGALGFVIIATFAAAWALSILTYRCKDSGQLQDTQKPAGAE